uniref:Uncharacterized protein n=1 Tax=Romanomermis culicivorax TaxID=13658 RepID=A0A915JVW8_ROMCU
MAKDSYKSRQERRQHRCFFAETLLPYGETIGQNAKYHIEGMPLNL